MDSSLIQTLFGFIADHIFWIIYLFAAIEIFLVFSIFKMMKTHEVVLADVSDNLLKGFVDAPDKDSTRSVHEKIEEALEFIRKKTSDDTKAKDEFAKNAKNINRRPLYGRHYKLESYTSIMSTIVQIFPLLGILGTILAIAQTAFGGDQIDFSSLSNAFVLAMDTTILGISFSIVFMVVESGFRPKIERIINESGEFRRILSLIQTHKGEA